MHFETPLVPSPAVPRLHVRDGAPARIERAARALVDDGWHAELQATSIHSRFATVFASYALFSVVATVLALHSPTVGAAIAAATAVAGMIDLAGGRSWVRVLTPRRGHRNVLLWAQEPAPDPFPGPWPDRARHPEPTPSEQVLLVLPAHPRRRRWSWGPAWGLLFGSTALLGILAGLGQPPQTTLVTHTAMTIALSVLAAISLGIGRRGRRPQSAQGIAAARSVVDALPTVTSARIGVVIVGGMEPWFDGLEVLLKSRGRRLPAWRTRFVVWHPGPGHLASVPSDGPFRNSAPAELLHAAETCDIPPAATRNVRPWRTGALRARRLGWPALGLVGGTNDTQTVARLAELLQVVGGADPAQLESTPS